MNTRALGQQGLEVPEIGFGCMSMTGTYGTPDAEEVLATIHRAIELRVNFLDTADTYGNGANEELVAQGTHPPCGFLGELNLLMISFAEKRPLSRRSRYLAAAALSALGTVSFGDTLYQASRIRPSSP